MSAELVGPARVIIAGSRSAKYRHVEEAIRESGWASEIGTVISGGAMGADQCGEGWALRYGRGVERFPVTEGEWRTFGKAAGPIRNRRMAQHADALIAVWDGESRGTRNMIWEAERAGIPAYVHRFAALGQGRNDG